jgi:hypothetical protein
MWPPRADVAPSSCGARLVTAGNLPNMDVVVL